MKLNPVTEVHPSPVQVIVLFALMYSFSHNHF